MEACLASRWARISAMVCGCSPSINFASCCGSALRRESSLPALVSAAERHLAQQFLGALLAEGLDQQLVGIFLSALYLAVSGRDQALEFLQHRQHRLGVDRLEQGDFARDLFDFCRRQMAIDLAGRILAEDHHQNRSLVQAGGCGRVAGHG